MGPLKQHGDCTRVCNSPERAHPTSRRLQGRTPGGDRGQLQRAAQDVNAGAQEFTTTFLDKYLKFFTKDYGKKITSPGSRGAHRLAATSFDVSHMGPCLSLPISLKPASPFHQEGRRVHLPRSPRPGPPASRSDVAGDPHDQLSLWGNWGSSWISQRNGSRAVPRGDHRQPGRPRGPRSPRVLLASRPVLATRCPAIQVWEAELWGAGPPAAGRLRIKNATWGRGLASPRATETG